MKFCFVDDSRQGKPTRDKLGPIVSIGGLIVDSCRIFQMEKDINDLCTKVGFPEGEVFKWSPIKNKHWMYENLTRVERCAFQCTILELIKDNDCKALFIAEDTNNRCAEKTSKSHEYDIVKLLIERVDFCYGKCPDDGIIICDRPPGGQQQEEKFLLHCLETLKEGTSFHKPKRIIMTVMSSPYRLSRLLQVADLITGCTLAYLCGESRYSPPVMEYIKPLFLSEWDRVGGVGVKLHPDFKYANLYHWLFGDPHIIWGRTGHPLPLPYRPFSTSPDVY
jgi:hypothetical protein